MCRAGTTCWGPSRAFEGAQMGVKTAQQCFHVFSDAGQSFSILTTFVLVSCVVTTADLTTAHPLELPQARWLPVTAHTSGAAPGARAQHTAPGATAGQHTTRAAHTRLIHLWSCTHASLRWAYAAIAP